MGYWMNLLLFKNVDEAKKAKIKKAEEIRILRANLVRAEAEMEMIDEAIEELSKKDKENF